MQLHRQANRARVFAVKEIFYTLQGEGFHAGRPAVFCRFSGCNLWSGREVDRESAQCNFCDTDFLGTNGVNGGKFADDGSLPYTIARLWPHDRTRNRLVVFTGGEPLLQLNAQLVHAMHALGFECAVETNGTLEPPPNIDWVTVSPKAGTSIRVKCANELKLVYPQSKAPPESFAGFPAHHYFLQPMDGPRRDENIKEAIRYCKENPQWRLGIQMHKYLGLP